MRGGVALVFGAYPAQAHGSFSNARGLQPVGDAGITLAQNQSHAAVFVVLGLVLVDADLVMAVVQRLQPVVVDLQVPE